MYKKSKKVCLWDNLGTGNSNLSLPIQQCFCLENYKNVMRSHGFLDLM